MVKYDWKSYKIVVAYLIFLKIALMNQLKLPIFLILKKPIFKKDDPLDKLN